MKLLLADRATLEDIDKDHWIILFSIPEGTNHISFSFDHGKKSIYLNGELYFEISSGSGSDDVKNQEVEL